MISIKTKQLKITAVPFARNNDKKCQLLVKDLIFVQSKKCNRRFDFAVCYIDCNDIIC